MNKKAIIIITIVCSLIGAAWLTRIVLHRIYFIDHSAYLTFEGYVLDQYGKPVPGANVTVAYPWPQGRPGQRHTEDDNTYTDDNGHYVYNSKPRRLLYAEAMAADSYDKEGNALGTAMQWITFTYEPINGWQGGSLAFDEKNGWHRGTPDNKNVILRIARSSGIDTMAASLQLNIDGDEAGTSVCFNANDGKLYPSPHEPCDFKLGIGPCEGGDGNWYEIATTENSADKGGVLWYHSARMSKMEAPPGDYPRSSRLYDKECLVPNPSDERRKPGESWPEFFFYSRGRQVYGLTTFDWVHQKKDTRIPVPWAEIRVLYNPKGTRNITPGNGGIDLPIQIPYKDTWTPDFSKIEVIEDKEKGEVRVIIKPNAIQYGEIVWIDNAPPDRGEEEEVKTDATNPNRELDLKIKADLNGNIALKIKYFPNGDRSGSEFYTISLRKIIAMKKAQSQSK